LFSNVAIFTINIKGVVPET